MGLQEAGLEPGRDFVFTISSAQGDLATLPSLIDAALDAKADVIVALQDETLKSAVERVKNTPVVFNVLSDPVRGRRRHQRLVAPRQHHRRLLAGPGRPGAGARGWR